MDAVRQDTSPRLPVADPSRIEWRADSDQEDRHAFPRREGYPARALCGERWTVRFGEHGAGSCMDCLAALREQVRSASVAIAEGEADSLADGDHYLYPAGVAR